ncbi:PAS domain S-box-containing protein [Asanoa hainanensis]|uniref:PAS domain S-box-containing protein n=1 Tax=Asanoa hainanensis TaxID=560556 RepID=A0A239P978_9ACTN|nr:PAS domain-containing protein [Asanoa hainanensis]SNT63676.1 PAS domain S-box-containing protein [Asanoa hainanensis]
MARRALALAAAVAVVLGAGIILFPGIAGVLWGTAGALAAGGILFGLRTHQPARRTPWILLAAAVAALGAGDVAYDLSGNGSDPGGAWLVVAEICYLTLFPLLAYALLGLTRTSAALRDRSTVVDLLSLVIAAGLVGWTVTTGPMSDTSTWPVYDRSLAAAHVLGSIVVVVVTSALVVATRARNVSALLLATGAVGLLAADTLEALAEVGAGVPGGRYWELGYLVCYAAWGAAALPPSMARLTLPVEPRIDSGRGLGILPVLLIALTGPGLLLVGDIRDDVGVVTVVAVGSALMTVLVATRLNDALTAQRRAVERERLLRHACGELVAAADAEAVAATLVAGIDRLLPRGHPHRVIFVSAIAPVDPDDGETLPLSGVAAGPPRLPSSWSAVNESDGRARRLKASEETADLRPALDRRLAAGQARATGKAPVPAGPVFGRVDAADAMAWRPLVLLDHQPPATAGGRRSRLSATRLLHPDLRGPLAGLPAALVASLAAEQPGRHRSPISAVAIAGDHAVLAGLQDTLEVLASQAALALRRVGHTVETSRRERDAYLSAVSERTADVVILLDADEWIRYASPSMADMLKVSVPILSTWRDIIHRDDHGQVENTLDRARSALDGSGVNTEWTLRRSDGSWLQVEVNCRDLRNHPAVQGLVLTLHDVTPDRRVDLPSTLRRLDRSAPGRNRRSVWRRFG